MGRSEIIGRLFVNTADMWPGSWLRARCASRKAPSTDRDRLEKLFQRLDVNKDGHIDMSEIQRGLWKQGISDPEEARVSVLHVPCNHL